MLKSVCLLDTTLQDDSVNNSLELYHKACFISDFPYRYRQSYDNFKMVQWHVLNMHSVLCSSYLDEKQREVPGLEESGTHWAPAITLPNLDVHGIHHGKRQSKSGE